MSRLDYKEKEETVSEKRFRTAEASVANEYGVHARPSALFCLRASRHPGKVYFKCLYNPEYSERASDKEYDCKNMMEMMSMEAVCGTRLKVHVEIGQDNDSEARKKKEADARTTCRDLAEMISSDLDHIVTEIEKERAILRDQ